MLKRWLCVDILQNGLRAGDDVMADDKIKKILFINLYVEMGGGEYSILNLFKGLDRNKFYPVMLFNKRGPFTEKVESMGIETVVIPFQSVDLKRLFSPKIFFRNIKASIQIYKYIRSNHIDIVQCSDVLALLMIIPAKILLRIPIIYSIIFYYEWIRLMLFNLIAVFFVRKIITNSKAVNNYLSANSMFLNDKTSVVYNGIDIATVAEKSCAENILRREFNISQDKKLLGMISRFDIWKGHKIFLKAASILQDKRNDLEFFIIGGYLNRSEVPSIQKYYDEVMGLYNELKSKVRFVPHRDDIYGIMKDLDIFVCPSNSEPFGLVILEAMAAGVPVVAADSGGPLEIIENNKDGKFFKTDDAHSLAETIEYYLDNKNIRNSILENARNKIQNDFNVRQYVNNMTEIYRSVNLGIDE